MENFREIVESLKEIYEPFHSGKEIWLDDTGDFNLFLPPWICQPYIRPPPVLKDNEISPNTKIEQKRQYEDSEGNIISRKKMKKLRRINRRPPKPVENVTRSLTKCKSCVNPLGLKCVYELCKKCCRNKCFLNNLDCAGHGILVKTRREKAIFYEEQNKKSVEISS